MNKLPDNNTLSALRARELQAPRYTSYPTALSMREGIDHARVLCELERANEEPIPGDLSLYVHIPFCASACFYCGCNRVISSRQPRHLEYLKHLRREIEAIARRVRRDRNVCQIHFGGGTPNMLDPKLLKGLIEFLKQQFTVSDQCEIGIEVDPRRAVAKDAQRWADAGFNRLSIGVQDLNEDVQNAINRKQSSTHIRRLMRAAKECGFSGINLDLIIGLPKQTVTDFQATLEQIALWQPDRVAVFQYAHMPTRFPAQRAIDEKELPSLSTRFAMQDAARKLFSEGGYQHIGLDHFARHEDSLAQAQKNGRLRRNFQGYSVLGDCDLLGFGASSISQIGRAMVQNTVEINDYQQCVAQGALAWHRGFLRTDEDVLRAAIIEELMCHGRTERADPDYFADAWDKLQCLDPKQQWVERAQSHWQILPPGQDFLRLIAQCFDARTAEVPLILGRETTIGSPTVVSLRSASRQPRSD